MKIYFYCYEHSIDRSTGLPQEGCVHVTSNKPSGDYGEVVLAVHDYLQTTFTREVVAEAAVESLEAKAESLKAETGKKLEAIADLLTVYKQLTHQPSMEEALDDDVPF